MPRVQVTKFHPVQISGDTRKPVVVKNIKGATVYYAFDPLPTSSHKEGELLESEEVTIRTPAWFVTKEATDTELLVSDGLGPASELANVPGRRLVYQYNGVIKESQEKAELLIGTKQSGLFVVNAGELTEEDFATFYFDPKLYEIVGRANTMTLDVVLSVNTKAPGASTEFVFGISEVEKIEGAAKKQKLTAKAMLAATKTTAIKNPAAKSISNHAEVTFSTTAIAAGKCVIAAEVLGEKTAAEADEFCTVTLYASS